MTFNLDKINIKVTKNKKKIVIEKNEIPKVLFSVIKFQNVSCNKNILIKTIPLLPHIIYKINLRWVTDLNVKAKTIRLQKKTT